VVSSSVEQTALSTPYEQKTMPGPMGTPLRNGCPHPPGSQVKEGLLQRKTQLQSHKFSKENTREWCSAVVITISLQVSIFPSLSWKRMASQPDRPFYQYY